MPDGTVALAPAADPAYRAEAMVEYGGGINNGPAGQVGGGGAPPADQSVDLFASVGNVIHDATSWISSLPVETLAIGIVVFFLGLIVLRRAF